MNLMKKADADHYLLQVERLGKAKSLPEEKRKRWQAEYDRLVAYLKENFKAYLVYAMTDGRNQGDIRAARHAVDMAKSFGVFDVMLAAVQAGDAEGFLRQCYQLRCCYQVTVVTRYEQTRKY